MFYRLHLVKALTIHPRFYGPQLRQTLTDELKRKVEGSCDGSNGYIFAVISVLDYGEPTIPNDGSGKARFTCTYDCVVMRPFKGEVLDCTVSQATAVRSFVSSLRAAATRSDVVSFLISPFLKRRTLALMC